MSENEVKQGADNFETRRCLADKDGSASETAPAFSIPAVLSIAGSDSSGGAGIQADIKTIMAHHLFAETAITALTAQNTLGVTGVVNVDPDFVTAQIDAIFDDIRPAAVKIGMVSSADIIKAIAQALIRHEAANIVVDPVMVATSGARLIDEDAIAALQTCLFPLASVITPNRSEAEVLCGFPVDNDQSMERAAVQLADKAQVAVLVKGGHDLNNADDVLVLSDNCSSPIWFRASRIATNNTHGTGCTLSSAIACGLAVGLSLEEAVGDAKDYVRGALSTGLDLGKGSGPLNHLWE